MAQPPEFSRRSLLGSAAIAGAALAVPSRAPAFVRSRPNLPFGVQSGDPLPGGAVVWTRADRPSRMLVEIASTPRFRRPLRIHGPVLDARTDFTGKVDVKGLPPGSEAFYRVVAVDLRNPAVRSRAVEGRLTTAPVGRRDVSLLWGADIAGQGWGINPSAGGFRIFKAMEALAPDLYLCSGDHIYADGVLTETGPPTAPPGWRQIVTPAKAKVAETLEEYRGQYTYNLGDSSLQSFNRSVTQIHQWDDHEVRNNWFPGQVFDDPRYRERRVDVLAERARRARGEYLPTRWTGLERDGRIYRKVSYGEMLDVFVLDMRTYKDPNDGNRYADPRRGLLGAAQRAWLKRELRRSRATWKLVANDLPLGLVVPDGETAQEAVAQGDGGAPLGRELEFADVLLDARRNGVSNLVFVTGDVHYAAAHHYHPSRAAIPGLPEFWEFVAGPLHAGTQASDALNPLDATFGPRRVFTAAAPAAGLGPAHGYQFFGQVEIDARSRVLTVSLRDIDGKPVFSKALQPRGVG